MVTTPPISGFKQTEIDFIPHDWEVKNLGEIGEPIIGLTYSPSNVKPQGLLVLRSSNIGDGVLVYKDNVFVDVAVPQRLIAQKDDILICVRNGSRPLIGKSALIDEHAAGMTFGAFMSLFRSQYSKFVFYCFQSDVVKRQIRAHLGATINQITNASLRSFRIPFPPPAEQQAIVSTLSDLDASIKSLDILIMKMKAIKMGAMQRLLTGKVRLPGFAGNWRDIALSDIGTLSKGRGIKRDDVSENGLACIRYGEIYTKYHNSVTFLRSRIPFAVAVGALPIQKGDLLFAGSGETSEDIGKCVAYMGDETAYAGGDIIVLSPNGEDSRFLGYALNHESVARQKAQFGQGDAVVHISATNLGRVRLRLPEPDEQRAIASVLVDMDTEIETLTLRRAKTNDIKRGAMQSLLTGRVRLKQEKLSA